MMFGLPAAPAAAAAAGEPSLAAALSVAAAAAVDLSAAAPSLEPWRGKLLLLARRPPLSEVLSRGGGTCSFAMAASAMSTGMNCKLSLERLAWGHSTPCI
jgi:hypothetical protein